MKSRTTKLTFSLPRAVAIVHSPPWETMEETGVACRQLFCRAAGCGVMFFVCHSCYRGHAYCTEECRQMTRREQVRQANQRYQQSIEARLDHRDRQRDYRQRRSCRVTDQSSTNDCSWGRISQPLVKLQSEPPTREKTSDDLSKRTWRESFRRIFCILCGRWGRFIAVFRE